MPEEIIEDNSLYTKYAILTLSEYFKLNEIISKAKGYGLGDSTARYAPVNPIQCKTNIQFTEVDDEIIETYDLAYVMSISTDVQEQHADLLPQLVDSYILAPDELSSILLDNGVGADYMLSHYSKVGDKAIDIIEIDNVRTPESDLAVNNLVLNDITIITNEEA